MRFIFAVMVLALLIPGEARAEKAFDVKGAQIAARVFRFLIPKPVAPIPVLVVVDPANPGAADAVKNGLGAEFAVTMADTVPDLSGKVGVILSTGGVLKRLPADTKGVLVISPDPACADAATCVVAITTTPKTEILVSRAALGRTGLDLETSFKMLTTAR